MSARGIGAIVFVNGASSSGKTSIVRALQETFAEPYLEAGLDRFLCSGDDRAV